MGTNAKRKGRLIRQTIVVILFAAIVACGIYGYLAWAAQSQLLGATFMSATGDKSKKFYLEVAADERSRALGLMWRKNLEPDGGMIFVYPVEAVHQFWMRNTYIPLDMVFLDKGLRVVGILENVPVLNEAPRFVDAKSQFIIELAAGTTSKEGIKSGSSVQFDKPLPQAR